MVYSRKIVVLRRMQQVSRKGARVLHSQEYVERGSAGRRDCHGVSYAELGRSARADRNRSTLRPKLFAGLRSISMDEVSHRYPLPAFGLQFQKFQRRVAATAGKQTLMLNHHASLFNASIGN